jgi:glutaredoxin-dependent peroxiredoxin
MAQLLNQTAPDFTLLDTDKKPVSLKDFAGKKVVLVFYPGAFTGVCTNEVCAFRDAMSVFNAVNAQVVGISVDSIFANKGFGAANKLTFPLLSDFNREVSKKYAGVYDSFAGVAGYTASKRSVFVIDAKGTVRYEWVTENPGVEPPYDEIKSVVEKI